MSIDTASVGAPVEEVPMVCLTVLLGDNFSKRVLSKCAGTVLSLVKKEVSRMSRVLAEPYLRGDAFRALTVFDVNDAAMEYPILLSASVKLEALVLTKSSLLCRGGGIVVAPNKAGQPVFAPPPRKVASSSSSPPVAAAAPAPPAENEANEANRKRKRTKTSKTSKNSKRPRTE